MAQLFTLESEKLDTLNLPYTIKGFVPFTSLTNLNRLVINKTDPIIFNIPISFNFKNGRLQDVYVPVGYSMIYEKAQQKNPKGYNDFVNYVETNIFIMYNYEESPNDGFYFIDIKEEGQAITKPVDLQRENYSFRGGMKNLSV